MGTVPLAVAAVVTSLCQHLISDEILPRAVGVNDSLNQVLRHIVVVGQKLLGVLRKAVAAVPERRVVVVVAYPRVETHSTYDGLGIQALHLGISVEFVEVADTQGKIGIGKELHGLRLGRPHEEHLHILLDGSFLDDGGKSVGRILKGRVSLLITYDDSAWVEIVIESLGLPQELGGKYDLRSDDLHRPVRLALPVGELLPD